MKISRRSSNNLHRFGHFSLLFNIQCDVSATLRDVRSDRCLQAAEIKLTCLWRLQCHFGFNGICLDKKTYGTEGIKREKTGWLCLLFCPKWQLSPFYAMKQCRSRLTLEHANRRAVIGSGKQLTKLTAFCSERGWRWHDGWQRNHGKSTQTPFGHLKHPTVIHFALS